LLPDKLQIQLNEFANESRLDVVTCQHALIRDHGLYYPRFAMRQYWLDVVWRIGEQYGGLWCANSPLWRKTCIQAIRGWNEQLRVFQDVELNVRAILSGLEIRRIEQILVHVREFGGDRITLIPERSSYLQHSILIAWNLLVANDKVTELRRKMVALRLYAIARQCFNRSKVIRGLYYWISGSVATGQPVIRVLHGLVLLIGLHYRYLQPIGRFLRPAFFTHLKELPDGITISPLEELILDISKSNENCLEQNLPLT
jgi:hypothetical protein